MDFISFFQYWTIYLQFMNVTNVQTNNRSMSHNDALFSCCCCCLVLSFFCIMLIMLKKTNQAHTHTQTDKQLIIIRCASFIDLDIMLQHEQNKKNRHVYVAYVFSNNEKNGNLFKMIMIMSQELIIIIIVIFLKLIHDEKMNKTEPINFFSFNKTKQNHSCVSSIIITLSSIIIITFVHSFKQTNLPYFPIWPCRFLFLFFEISNSIFEKIPFFFFFFLVMDQCQMTIFFCLQNVLDRFFLIILFLLEKI